ncbi:hypothetical protein BDF20DRAFT_812765, partial [Mycotypha africana]|uniref:uncharacterized protein n=1 Tax=Mycotypha africana TaxID=64632 RepID=UPI0022FFEE7E
LIVIGGIALDITATTSVPSSARSLKGILHTSTLGQVKQTLGGVGRNVAESAWRSGAEQVKLVSVVGQDMAGDIVKAGMKKLGMQTAVYNALHSSDGQLVAAVADMSIFEAIHSEKVKSERKRVY